MRIGSLIALAWIAAFTAIGQNIDEERMDRDLKIAENILSTLVGSEGRSRLFNSVESNYLPDYGVIFSIPQSAYVFSPKLAGKIIYSGTGAGSGTGYTYTISEEDEDGEISIVQLSGEEGRKAAEKERGDLAKEMSEKQKEQITTFLVDYADLIGQLKPSERIVVQVRSGNERIFISGQGKLKQPSSLSGHIMKSDLMAYKQGKKNREETLKLVKFVSEDGANAAKDVELFATLFARLYEPDLSSTYYVTARSIGYTNLEGYGVTFNMKVYSSSSEGGIHSIRTSGQSGLSREERDEIVNAMYPEFEQTFKENLLDYGRTVRSLDEKEVLIFKVKLTECKGCDMPEEIEVSVYGKTLKAYDKGSLSKDNALKQVTVKKK